MTDDSIMGLRPLPDKQETVLLLKKLVKDLKIKQGELSKRAGIPQSEVSRALGRSKRQRPIKYEELQAYIEVVLDRYWSLPKKKRVRNLAVMGGKLVSVYSDQRVREAAQLMKANGFSQLPVLDRATGKHVGIVTDGTIMERMLIPKAEFDQRGLDWIRTYADKTLQAADVVEQTPTLSTGDSLDVAARNLMYHYALLVEDREELGIITRNDFLDLVLEDLRE